MYSDTERGDRHNIAETHKDPERVRMRDIQQPVLAKTVGSWEPQHLPVHSRHIIMPGEVWKNFPRLACPGAGG